MILPSLLEYSSLELTHKLEMLENHNALVTRLTRQNDALSLHLDFVLKRFAQDRSALMSTGITGVFDTTHEIFANKKLRLYIHLMGDAEDLYYTLIELKQLEYQSHWEYYFFVPEKFKESFENELGQSKFFLKFGVWYDLGEWESVVFQKNWDYLLMTVKAGRSGQQPKPRDKQHALNIAEKHVTSNFILDGGWQIHEDPMLKNTMIVSHSGFWKSFEGELASK